MITNKEPKKRKSENNMRSIAVYPGSFDPIHLGHIDIIERVSPLFDEIVVLISQSVQKQSLFSPKKRRALIEQSTSHISNVSVDVHGGLTIDYMREHRAKVIIRGLRAVVDFEYEISMANMNKKLAPEVETLLMFAHHDYYFISSRGIKEVAQNFGSLEDLVPACVVRPLISAFKN